MGASLRCDQTRRSGERFPPLLDDVSTSVGVEGYTQSLSVAATVICSTSICAIGKEDGQFATNWDEIAEATMSLSGLRHI